MEFVKLRDFYMAMYPTDDLGKRIDSKATFQDLFDALDGYRNVYDTIGVGDSIIRERLFFKLAQITGITYEDVYEQWLRAA